MLRPIVWIFLLLSATFALVHVFAVYASLYWYWSWFDIIMHIIGGGLIALGIHAFATFSRLHFRPNLTLLLTILLVVTVGWEVFEWLAGLYDPTTHFKDTTKDIVLGFLGGLVGHRLLRRFRIGSNE